MLRRRIIGSKIESEGFFRSLQLKAEFWTSFLNKGGNRVINFLVFAHSKPFGLECRGKSEPVNCELKLLEFKIHLTRLNWTLSIFDLLPLLLNNLAKPLFNDQCGPKFESFIQRKKRPNLLILTKSLFEVKFKNLHILAPSSTPVTLTIFILYSYICIQQTVKAKRFRDHR